MLVARHLRKRYRTRDVVKDFGLHLAAGEVVGLLGPNGAGKTTCFYMIVGLVAADGGEIVLDGDDITALPMHKRARRGVGYLPQEPSIFRRLSVSQNIMAALELRDDLDAQGRENELLSLLEELQIAHVASQRGASLSGGEPPREIARWPPSRASCCWTNRSPALIRSRSATSRRSSATSRPAASASSSPTTTCVRH